MDAYVILNNIANYPIEKIPDTLSQEVNKKLRLERENFWIRKLKTHPPYGMNSGANANSESIVPFTIKYSSTAKVASHKIRSLFTQLKETLAAAFGHKFITACERNKNLKDFLC